MSFSKWDHVSYVKKEYELHEKKSFYLKGLRTSDSLNEELPIKMTREKFQRKWYFFYEKEIRFNPRLIHKSRLFIG